MAVLDISSSVLQIKNNATVMPISTSATIMAVSDAVLDITNG